MWRTLLYLLSLVSGQQEVVFRTSVELIRVDVQVLDGDKTVLGLKREDFVVLDEGIVQPILEFGAEQQELDLLLALDFSASMHKMLASMKEQARVALTKLYFRDRVGVIVFDNLPYLVIEPTWDWLAVEKAIQGIQLSRGGTELNQSAMLAAQYLRLKARPEARRGLIVLTDNIGGKAISNARLRDALWESDVVLSAVFFPPLYAPQRGYGGNLQPSVDATGGESIKLNDDSFDLGEILKRMRQRYGLMYRAPGGKPGSVRRIEVKMAASQHKHWKIRARSGYKVGIANSEAREKMTLP